MRTFVPALLCCAAALPACSNTASVDLAVGPYSYTVDAAMLDLPMQFHMGSTVASVPCTSDGACPQFASHSPAVVCNAGHVCDPQPFQLEFQLGDVIDFNAYRERLGMFGDHIDTIELQNVRYTATFSGLNIPVGPTEVYWAPPSARTASDASAHHLGTVPVVNPPAGGTASGALNMDTAGETALSDYLLHQPASSRQFILFARPGIDVNPGSPWPNGTAQISVTMDLVVEGQIVR